MKVPADLYTRSARVYRGMEDVTCPFADATFIVAHCGRICFHGRKINLSHAFAGQNVGVTQVGEDVCLHPSAAQRIFTICFNEALPIISIR